MEDFAEAPESLEEIQQSNQRRLADFQAQGVAVNIPSAPGPLVELLIEAVIGPQGSPEWEAFVYAYEARVRSMLDGIAPQVARARLMAAFAPNGPPPMRPV
jgi:hypothetical protein